MFSVLGLQFPEGFNNLGFKSILQQLADKVKRIVPTVGTERMRDMYENNSRYPFEAFITNLGEYTEGRFNGKWVGFPLTAEEMQHVLESIDIGKERDGVVYEEYFITDFEDHVGAQSIGNIAGEYPSLNELNYLAKQIDELDEGDLSVFMAVMEVDSFSSIKDLINLTNNLDNYSLQPDIEDEFDLGKAVAENYEIPDGLEYYINYEELGRDTNLNEPGGFTTYGYLICESSEMTLIYDGTPENIPEEYRVVGRSKETQKEIRTETEDELSEDMMLDDPAEHAPRM